MKLTLEKIKKLIKEVLKEEKVPQEVKEKIWEVEKGDRGAVEHNGKYYYGEI